MNSTNHRLFRREQRTSVGQKNENEDEQLFFGKISSYFISDHRQTLSIILSLDAMLPMSSTNHHSHMEPSWKTYYDAKKLLRQTEQRLKDTREYYPHVHLNPHHETNDLSNGSSSSFLLYGETSSIHAGNRSMFNDERTSNSKHQILDSEALQTIRRKINKQKIAAGIGACFLSRTSRWTFPTIM